MSQAAFSTHCSRHSENSESVFQPRFHTSHRFAFCSCDAFIHFYEVVTLLTVEEIAAAKKFVLPHRIIRCLKVHDKVLS